MDIQVTALVELQPKGEAYFRIMGGMPWYKIFKLNSASTQAESYHVAVRSPYGS